MPSDDGGTVYALVVGGLGSLVAIAAVAHLARHREAMPWVASVESDETPFVLRLDPPTGLSSSVRASVVSLVVIGALGVVWPVVGWTEASMVPALGVGWLASLGVLGLGLAGVQHGLAWPAASQRLGIGLDEVWWEPVERGVRPSPRPTSAATRLPRDEVVLTFDRQDALLLTARGTGLTFGPLTDDARDRLRTAWTAR